MRAGSQAVAALLVLRFLSELALLAVLAVDGALLAAPGPVRLLAAVLAPVAAAVVWGLLVAPRARRRLTDPARLVVEVVLFVVAGGWLAAVGHPEGALTFTVGCVAAAVLVRRYAPES
jgi:hypothetical protein